MMFWKAVVVALWVAAVESWQAYRKRRMADGLPLKMNRKGVYVVSDWTAKVDWSFRLGRNTVHAVVLAWWIFLGYYLLTGQRDELASIIQWMFTVSWSELTG